MCHPHHCLEGVSLWNGMPFILEHSRAFRTSVAFGAGLLSHGGPPWALWDVEWHHWTPVVPLALSWDN